MSLDCNPHESCAVIRAKPTPILTEQPSQDKLPLSLKRSIYLRKEVEVAADVVSVSSWKRACGS
jgi:hypothetical protein